MKKQLGQYFSTNKELLQDLLELAGNQHKIIEPFAGNCDLINFLNFENIDLELYDIDPKLPNIIKRNTFLDVPDFNHKFVITNPPYLAKNKSKDKSIFQKFEEDDLYKCFIKILCGFDTSGILIIPVNFWSSSRKNDTKLRKEFLIKFQIIKLYIFEKPMFEDTSCSVCSFLFKKRTEIIEDFKIKTICISENYRKKINLLFNDKNNYTILGEIFCNKAKIVSRLIKESENKTNICVKCIDDKEPIQAFKGDFIYDTTPKQSNRSYMTLCVPKKIDEDLLIQKFNNFLNEKRLEFNSLFLSNYREFNRKRITFEQIYTIFELFI